MDAASKGENARIRWVISGMSARAAMVLLRIDSRFSDELPAT